jgi:hypothetical protein
MQKKEKGLYRQFTKEQSNNISTDQKIEILKLSFVSPKFLD